MNEHPPTDAVKREPNAVQTKTCRSEGWPGTLCKRLLITIALLVPPSIVGAQSLRPITGLSQLAGGSFHTCALTTAGGVRCWGSNSSGQLGDGTTTRRVTPTDVVGLSSGVQAVASGSVHSCALLDTGAVKCWGAGANGQLGNGDTADSTIPVDVLGLPSGVSAISAGGFHTCAVTSTGGLKCWGWNSNGRLGDGTTTSRSSPVDVLGLETGAAAVAAGAGHTCALTTGGGVKCWGTNTSGRLGDGTTTVRLTAVDVVGLASGIGAIAVGGTSSCALTTAGGVKCWGANVNGQIGDGTTTQRLTAVDVFGLASGVDAIAVGNSHACARSTAGTVKCWGRNFEGQLGSGGTSPLSVPTDVQGLPAGITAITAGQNHSCALAGGGEALCWGNNLHGQLGDGGVSGLAQATPVSGLGSGALAVAAGENHACAISGAGAAKCWGYNGSGQLGDGTVEDRRSPADVGGLGSGVANLAGGAGHTCALTSAGGLRCWGANDSGQLGNGGTTNSSTPVEVTGLATGVAAVTLGFNYTCALTVAGGMKCWGNNLFGQLGDGTTTSRTTPVDVPGLTSGVSSIAAGNSHTCAVVAGGVQCWGNNGNGQLGDGSTTSRSTPAPVQGLSSGVASIAAGSGYTCAVTTSGGVKCWGANSFGQLGDNSLTQRTSPVDVAGLGSGVSRVTLGVNHSCALTLAGGVQCWGFNQFGQLGDGSNVSRAVPAGVDGLGSGVQGLVAGGAHTCALRSGGAVVCWGDDQQGEVGDGGRNFGVPAAVVVNDAPRNVASVTPAANNASLAPRSDASGRFVVFQSTATNLTGGPDGNGASDIFRVDLQTGLTERMSVDDAGGEIGAGSIEPAVSADGGLVVFVAPDAAVNKLHGETKSARERRQKAGGFGVFLRNVLTGQTGRTVRVGNALAGGTGTKPQISADGRKVVFSGESVGAEGVEGQANVFLVGLTGAGGERVPQPRECVSCQARSAMGLPTENSDGGSAEAVVSADGTWVAYTTQAKNQVGGAPSPCPGPTTEVNLRNMLTGVVRRVSPPPGLPPLNCGVVGSGKPSIDWSGLNLAFQSDQALTPGALAGREHVFTSTVTGFTRLSEAAGGVEGNADATQPAISGDGTTVAYVSAATNLDASFVDGNGRADSHVRRQGRGTERLSKSVLGAEADQDSNRPALNYNGTRLVFDSAASNLVSGDVNAVGDVFQRAIPAATDVVFATGFD